jgi:hypothetical protein
VYVDHLWAHPFCIHLLFIICLFVGSPSRGKSISSYSFHLGPHFGECSQVLMWTVHSVFQFRNFMEHFLVHLFWRSFELAIRGRYSFLLGSTFRGMCSICNCELLWVEMFWELMEHFLFTCYYGFELCCLKRAKTITWLFIPQCTFFI